ncbi:MAG: glutathione S-transferase family protein [Propionivibrio sp.]
MKHRLLGLFDSPYVRRVAIAMVHYGIPFDHESLSVFRHVEEMRRTNPLLRVPMLTTPDGMTLHESAFILDYLDEVARESGREALIPASGLLRRKIWQRVALAQIAADKTVAIVYEHRRPPELRWAEWEERVRDQLTTALQQLEDALDGDWLVDGRLTHADIMAAVAVSFIRFTEPGEWPSGRFPRLEALTRRLEQTPAFLAVPIDKE